MLKKVFLAAAASLIVAGATMTMAPTPAQAGSGCHKAASKAERKACKAHHKAHKKAHKKHGLFRRK